MKNRDDEGILLVEDDPGHRELILMALKDAHFKDRVYVAQDGQEALDFLFSRDSKPRFILLDLELPKISGLEVLRRIKVDAWSRSIPVIMLTSSQNDRDIKLSFQWGANSYIVKPIQFDKFVDAIGKLGHYWLGLNEGKGEYTLP